MVRSSDGRHPQSPRCLYKTSCSTLDRMSLFSRLSSKVKVKKAELSYPLHQDNRLNIRFTNPLFNMKLLSVLGLAAAASAVALPGDDWKTWQSCAKTTQMVTVTAIPQKQIEYKTQYQTKYETKYDTKYETKYGMLASLFHFFANYTYFYQKLRLSRSLSHNTRQKLRLLRSLSHNTRQSTRRSRSRSRSTRQSIRQSRSQLRNMSPKLSTRPVC